MGKELRKKKSPNLKDLYIDSYTKLYIESFNDITYKDLGKKKNKKFCGYDNKNNKLYFKNECPINYIEITNQPKPSKNFTFSKTLRLGNKKYLHYTNENIEGKILVEIDIKKNEEKNCYCYQLYQRTYRGINSYSKNKIIFVMKNYKICRLIIFIFLFFVGQNLSIYIFYKTVKIETNSNFNLFNFFLILNFLLGIIEIIFFIINIKIYQTIEEDTLYRDIICYIMQIIQFFIFLIGVLIYFIKTI